MNKDLAIMIETAIKAIKCGFSKKVIVNNNIIVYKVPTGNENKYTIRIDIKID